MNENEAWNLSRDPKWVVENLFEVRDKNLGLVPFKLKPTQLNWWENHTARDIIGKSRSLYISTGVEALFTAITVTTAGITYVIVAQDEDWAKIHLRTCRNFIVGMPEYVDLGGGNVVKCRPEFVDDSAFKLTLAVAINPQGNVVTSEIVSGSAASIGAFRGKSFHLVQVTEAAIEKEGNVEDTISALESVNPMLVVVESTGAGEGNAYHRRFMAALNGKSEYKYHFFAWMWDKDNPELQLSENSPLALPEDRGPITPTEEESALMLKWGLSIENIRWRRMQASKPLFKQERAEDPYTMFLSGGQPVFDGTKLTEMMAFCKEPILTEEAGFLKIWLMPATEGKYMVVCDPAGGNIDGHFCAATVWKLTPFIHVATLRGHWESQIFALKCLKLAKRYNNAWIVGERNYHGVSFHNTLKNQEHYDKIYYHKDPLHLEKRAEIGFPMDRHTKPAIIDAFSELIVNGELVTYSANGIAEARQYRYLGNVGESVGPPYGGYDDELDTDMIANYVRNRIEIKSRKPVETVSISY